MADRELKNWIHTFLDWTLPRSEAPASMVLWAGMFALAATVRRKVYIPKSKMGSYEIHPNLYIIFVGNPGVVRKSTTAGYSEELLIAATEMMEQDQITFASTAVSSSRLLEKLAASPDSSMTIISSEFSSFIGISREAMYEILTDVYDGKRKFGQDTRMHGLELAEKPVVNLLAATTPAWISGQPPAYFLGGGFASRVLFVYEQERRQYKLFYDNIDYTEVEATGAKLSADLAHIATLEGEFTFENKALQDDIEAWYVANAKNVPDDERARGFHEREHVHVLKTSMLLSLAERDDLVIAREHYEGAKAMLSDLKVKLPRALASVGDNPMGAASDGVIDFIRSKGGVATRKQVMQRFYRDFSMDQLGELVSALEVLGEITIHRNGNANNPEYKLKEVEA